jgi:hypothetical protein
MSNGGMDRRRRQLWPFSIGALALLVAVALAHAQLVGDADCDGRVNSDDLAALVAAVFADPQTDCVLADVNGDGGIEGADIVSLTQVLTAPPPTPGPSGPQVTFFGLAAADGVPLRPLGELNGIPVVFRSSGSGFKIIVEGGMGLSGLPGTVTLNTDPHDAARRPDLQIESSSDLGEGSPDVCDQSGVPAVNPPDFGPAQAVADALNDFACSFTSATASGSSCTLDAFGNNSFVDQATQVQFCLQVARTLEVPVGDTLLSVQLRDTARNIGPLRQLILRVQPGPPPATFTPTPTRVPTTPRPTGTPTRSRTPTRTPTPNRFTPSATATITRSRTPGPSPTLRPSATRTATASPASTPTSTPPVGPVVTFFGLTASDDSLLEPDTVVDGVPVYFRPNGAQFSLVVEAKPGADRAPVGQSAYQADLMSFPDLQVEVSQRLGDGSDTVCDRSGSHPGGVPAVDPPNFEPTERNIAAVNDLTCRFLNGQGSPGPRSRTEDPCVKFPGSEDSGFVKLESTIQYCGFIDRYAEFQPGDTVVTVRLRDECGNAGPPECGNAGPPAQLIVHVGP